jgi:hypothetical protein
MPVDVILVADFTEREKETVTWAFAGRQCKFGEENDSDFLTVAVWRCSRSTSAAQSSALDALEARYPMLCGTLARHGFLTVPQRAVKQGDLRSGRVARSPDQSS